MSAAVDVLIPTCGRPAALAVTLCSLVAQTLGDFRIVFSDQTLDSDVDRCGEVQAVLRVHQAHGRAIEMHKHLPPRGMAEQRQFLLDRANAPRALFLDDDLILEPFVVGAMVRALDEERCGFVGSAVIGLSHLQDERPDEQTIEFWDRPVTPELVRPGSPAWRRHQLHNAANLYHLQRRLGYVPPSCGAWCDPEPVRKYRVAWVGGCVLYDSDKLRASGGFSFWRQLPSHHCGEDVLAQLRVMARYGGCGILPSGVYHQELATTIRDRRVDAPQVLDLELDASPRDAYSAPRRE